MPTSVGRFLSPPVATVQQVGNFPVNMVTTPDGKFAVSTGVGREQELCVVSLADGRLVSHLDFHPPGQPLTPEQEEAAGDITEKPKPAGLYFGLAFGADGSLYAAQGAHDSIGIFTIAGDGALSESGTITTRHGDFPAGLAIDSRGYLFACDNASASDPAERPARGKRAAATRPVTRPAVKPFFRPGSVAIYDTASRKEIGRYTFADSFNGTSNYPLAVAALRDGRKIYVTSERDNLVYVLDTTDAARPQLSAKIETGAAPTALLLDSSQRRLFVANSSSDTISMINTSTDTTTGTLLLRPPVAAALPGATPTGLALSADEKTLYVTLGAMNAVAVVDVPTLVVRGYLPTGWYPTAVVVGPNGLLVTDAKGSGNQTPTTGYNPFVEKIDRTNYILTKLVGDVRSIPLPASADELVRRSNEVLDRAHVADLYRPAPAELQDVGIESGKIRHVIYVLKENRTYDQVLGDEPAGNGDRSIAIFGRDVTPNQHALAERFVLLDNAYACGDVSGDGWVWSTQGMVNAYVARNIPYGYSFRGRTFDYEGQNNGYITGGFPATNPDGTPTSTQPAFADGAPTIPDVAQTGKHLWDVAHDAGLTVRNYGFYLSADKITGYAGPGGLGMPDNYPTVPGLQPPGHDLAGVTDADFRKFDLDYPDSDAPNRLLFETGDPSFGYKMLTYGKYAAPSRISEWRREFHQMLAKDPAGSAVPNLMLVRLGHDHTQGVARGKHAPRAEVADNDVAVGQLVEAVSHSPIWDSTAIFAIEDDAQTGPDHVDCHRTTCYVISPWIKSASVDHRFCNTDGVLKTMEVLLGLPPMTQYDAAASPILDWDDRPSNSKPYDTLYPSNKILGEMNLPPAPKKPGLAAEADDDDNKKPDPATAIERLADISDAMDFNTEDTAPAGPLNEAIWKSVRGIYSVMPAPRGVVVQAAPGKKDDDD